MAFVLLSGQKNVISQCPTFLSLMILLSSSRRVEHNSEKSKESRQVRRIQVFRATVQGGKAIGEVLDSYYLTLEWRQIYRNPL